MCEHNKSTRMDQCIKDLVAWINSQTTWTTLASCCGHSKYPMTIVCKCPDLLSHIGHPIEICSMKFIPRKRKFYKLDPKGYYYIPEVIKK